MHCIWHEKIDTKSNLIIFLIFILLTNKLKIKSRRSYADSSFMSGKFDKLDRLVSIENFQ